MHGVGEILDGLSDFVGLRLLAVNDLENIVYFRFAKAAEAELQIGVECEWLIRDKSDDIVVSGRPRPSVVIAGLPVGSVVVTAETRPPRTIVVRFLSGHTLEIIDNSDQYESLSIPHANVYI